MAKSRRLRRAVFWGSIGVAAVMAITGILVLAANLVIIHDAKPFLVSSISQAPRADVVIVPGALVRPDNEPNPMAADRVELAVQLYKKGLVKALDLSGSPDEIPYMRDYALSHGVPAKDILEDPAGDNTYATMANAARLFHVRNALISTQRFHLSRAVYLARALGIEAIGVPSDLEAYPHDIVGTVFREWGARFKAFVMVHF
ncbi:MAG: YdcF family protein [Actinobacteria bacterium]|nr:YdcF family protein [Actinomycetota bacterium]